MEHIHGFFELGHIEDSIGPACIPNGDFLDSRSDGRHRLPIIRFFSLLNFEQLKASAFLHWLWKLTQIVASRSNKMNRLHYSPILCHNWHIRNRPCGLI